MIAPGPDSSINREYYAQEHEKEIEEGRGGVEAYEKTDDKAMGLLKRLAQSEPYSKRRRIDEDEEGRNMKALPAPEALQHGGAASVPGPIRTRDTRGRGSARGAGRGGRGGGRGGRFPASNQAPPSEEDWLPPEDPNVKSLFIVGVEDDLPEYKIREFFSKYGALQSVVCSHSSHCAYINNTTSKAAELGADSCHGKAIIAGCPLRVTWGRPKQLDTIDRDQRIANAQGGRAVAKPRLKQAPGARQITSGEDEEGEVDKDDLDGINALAPPGQDDVKYASLAGD